MKCITVQQFLEMLAALPEEVRQKEIQYIDISWVDQSELKDLQERFLNNKDKMIGVCS